MTAPHRYYKTRQWYELRRLQLANEPWCRICARLGRHTRATTVDHVRRHFGNAEAFFNGPLQSLCPHCHSSIKRAFELSGHRAACDVNGRPLSSQHHWSQPRRGISNRPR